MEALLLLMHIYMYINKGLPYNAYIYHMIYLIYEWSAECNACVFANIYIYIYVYAYVYAYVNGEPTHNAYINNTYIYIYIYIYGEISYVGPIVMYIMYIYMNLLRVCSGGIPRSIHRVIDIYIYIYRCIYIHTYINRHSCS